MNWIFGAIALFTCAVSGLLGLTAGINLNPVSTVSFVPNWGSLGDWVSGVGALLAVITSFVLVRRNERSQAEREREHLVVDQWASDFTVSIRVISRGYLPCTIKGVLLEGPAGGAIDLQRLLPGSSKVAFPVRLEVRSDLQLAWHILELTGLLNSIALFDPEQQRGLRLCVATAMDEHRFDLSQEILDMWAGAARAQEIEIFLAEKPPQ